MKAVWNGSCILQISYRVAYKGYPLQGDYIPEIRMFMISWVPYATPTSTNVNLASIGVTCRQYGTKTENL